jgi:hypothetical protein
MNERRQSAKDLVGCRVVQVAYVTIDYNGWELGYRDQLARRIISDTSEWHDPAWNAETFHHLDYGVELTTQDGDLWAITWDPPGATESLVLQPGLTDAVGAVWDVTTREPWARCISSPITQVQLRYHPWDEQSGSFWCTRVSLSFGKERVEIILGDRDFPSSALVPAADNIAVLLDPDALPAWERTDDLV